MHDRRSVCSVLDDHTSFSLVVHAHADLDTLGAAIGLGQALDGQSRIIAPDGVQRRARRLPDELGVHLQSPTDDAVSATDCLVVVDAPSADRIAPVSVADSTGDVIVIDHHEPADLAERATAAYIDTEASATAVLVARVLDALNRPLGATAGVSLAAGLLADARSVAEMRAEEVALLADLLAAAGDRLETLPRILRIESSFGERVAAAKAVVRATGYRADRTLVLTTTVSGEQTAAARALRTAGADVALVVSDRDPRTWVVGRADPDVVHLPDDVFTPLIDQYGGDGGGHAGAGVAKLDTGTPEGVRSSALDALEDTLDESLSRLS
ncbi:MAG: bifunctional oligoribonuclease/PAP phosphatase NrnA [Haloplanus sp.]